MIKNLFMLVWLLLVAFSLYTIYVCWQSSKGLSLGSRIGRVIGTQIGIMSFGMDSASGAFHFLATSISMPFQYIMNLNTFEVTFIGIALPTGLILFWGKRIKERWVLRIEQ